MKVMALPEMSAHATSASTIPPALFRATATRRSRPTGRAVAAPAMRRTALMPDHADSAR